MTLCTNVLSFSVTTVQSYFSETKLVKTSADRDCNVMDAVYFGNTVALDGALKLSRELVPILDKTESQVTETLDIFPFTVSPKCEVGSMKASLFVPELLKLAIFH